MDYTLEDLKEMAKKLNFSHSPNIGIEKLTERLTAHATDLGTDLEEVYSSIKLDKEPVTEETSTNIGVLGPLLATALEGSLGGVKEDVAESEIERLKTLTFSGVEATQAQLDEAKQTKEATKLIRCIITCVNKNKTSYQGEIFTVRNAIIPEYKKFIPFGTPTHVPQIMFNVIKEKQYQMFREEKLPNGTKIKRAYMIPEYNIQILDPITRDEFEAIRKKQLAEGYTGE